MKPHEKSATDDLRLEGLYANTFKVGYNSYEFVLDFGQHFSESGDEKFHTRIVTNPKHVMLFFDLLQEAIEKYKASGPISPDLK